MLVKIIKKINEMERVIIKVEPVTLRDDEGNYTIYDGNNKGGAIISDKDSFEAMKRFKEAMQLCVAVRTLIEMKEGGKNFYMIEY
jgi:hypothetical protein